MKNAWRASALSNALTSYADDSYDYLKEWLYKEPVVVTQSSNAKLRDAGLVLNKFIKHFGTRFCSDHLYELMPVSDRVKHIVDVFNQKDTYDVGTFRTDFVFDTELDPKFIEITCQFSFNAFFQSAFYYQQSLIWARENNLEAALIDDYQDFSRFVVDKIGDAESIVVVRGRDRIQASRFFMPILRGAGYEVCEIEYQDVWSHRALIRRSFVVSEIMMDEIESLSDAEIELLADANVVNDYRSVFIAHDKRFLRLLTDKQLQADILEPEEAVLLNRYLIDTYQCDREPQVLTEALESKDEWILKHISLGRSREIYAGLEFSEEDWVECVRSADPSKFVLQKWVPQRLFSGSIDGVSHNDYLTGTLLYFDEAFFGLGLFRSSSHFVANKVDNRNVRYLCLEDGVSLSASDYVARF